MSKSEEKPTETQIERVESVHSRTNPANDDASFKAFSEKEQGKKKNIFLRFKDSIYSKPEHPQNAWHLLTNLNNTQRITFAAGIVYMYGCIKTLVADQTSTALNSLLWLDFGCL